MKIIIKESQLKRIHRKKRVINEGVLDDILNSIFGGSSSGSFLDKLRELLQKILGSAKPVETKKEEIKTVLKDTKKEIVDVDLNKKFKFALIPDGKNNYRSAQITAEYLPSVIKKYNIKNIIRLNGDTSDDMKHKDEYKKISSQEEKKICEENGCNFYRVSSHDGYKKNKGYTTSVDKVTGILSNGNTLIHCAHGADRTGGMVGGYLLKTGIITDKDKLWDYTTKFNEWENRIKKGNFFGSGYDKYADCFYPIDELKNKFK